MPICNNDLICACFTGSADGGIYILSHLFAKTGVFGMTWRDLLPGCHAGNSFHICCDQDFHGDSPFSLSCHPRKPEFIDDPSSNPWIMIIIALEDTVSGPLCQDM